MGFIQNLFYPFRHPAPPPPRPATGFFTDTTLCIGCKACEVACKQWNQLPSDGFNFTGDSYDNTGSLSATTWRHVAFIEQFPEGGRAVQAPEPAKTPSGSLDIEALLAEVQTGRWLMMSDVCKHCSAAPCEIACPTGALVVNEFSNVYVQNDICNGCGYCVAACPFGVIERSLIDGHAHKCTLCFDRQRDDMTPACAKACPTASIQFGPIDELRDRARTRVSELHARGKSDAYLYGDSPTQSYSELGAFFLLLDKPSRYGLPDAPERPQLHMPGDWIRTGLGALLSVAIIIYVLLEYAG
ncbi:MAG: 4Fe-4S dicluster domain-containing protein [Candidatus Binataceae bacterium]